MMAWFPGCLAFDWLIVRGATQAGRAGCWSPPCVCRSAVNPHLALVAFTPLLAASPFPHLTVWRREEETPARDLPDRNAALGRPCSPAAQASSRCCCSDLPSPLFVEGPLLTQEEWTRDTYHYRLLGSVGTAQPVLGIRLLDDAAGADDGMGFQWGRS